MLKLFKSANVFSNSDRTGVINKNQQKYKKVENLLISIKGDSGCCDPMQVKMKKFPTKSQKEIRNKGLNWPPLVLDKSANGRINKINKDPNIAITPKSLLGIERNIA